MPTEDEEKKVKKLLIDHDLVQIMGEGHNYENIQITSGEYQGRLHLKSKLD